MAPSTRGARVAKRQAPLRAFTKVTKSIKPQFTTKSRVCEEIVGPLVEVPQPHQTISKRKWSVVENDGEAESENVSLAVADGKKV